MFFGHSIDLTLLPLPEQAHLLLKFRLRIEFFAFQRIVSLHCEFIFHSYFRSFVLLHTVEA
jgi:hypothetical protein